MKNAYPSIIIPTWNSSNTLGICLECIRKIFGDVEIIIVDRYSRDRTVEIAHKYGCRIFYNDVSLGSARMEGIRRADSEFVIFIDDDNQIDESFPKIFNYVDKMTGAVQCSAMPLDQKKVSSESLSVEESCEKILSLRDRGYTHATIIRRELLLDLDISGVNAYEDWAISRHVIKKGYLWKVVPVIVWHDHRATDAFSKAMWNTHGLFQLTRQRFITIPESSYHYFSRLLGAFRSLAISKKSHEESLDLLKYIFGTLLWMLYPLASYRRK